MSEMLIKAVAGLIALIVGVEALSRMQMHALDHGVDGTIYVMTTLTIGGLIAGYCGFQLKEVFNWWKGRNGP